MEEYHSSDQETDNISVWSSKHKYKPVQIYAPTHDGSGFEIDRDNLESVFAQEGVADKPVAIYSLAGAFRTGKSFLLNLFIRYLHSGRSDAWLNDKAEELVDGFGWRGGGEPCTKGIWLWNEPFHMITEEKKEVVIFLLDTQGAFDHHQDLTDCTSIFSLSTLISSCQIFNLMRNIQENDLQHLQMFTEYGKLTKQEVKNQKGKAFQNLLFLVRDYFDPSYNGFEGGKHILSKVLKIGQKKGDLKSVRENIHESFDNVECFLLTPPGDLVAYRSHDSAPLKLSDVSERFVENVSFLARYLFKDNVFLKKLNGQPVTGKKIIHITVTYCNMFKNGKMPKIKDIMKANAEIILMNTLQQCKETYINQMTGICEREYLFPEKLDILHQKWKNIVLAQFDDKPRFSEDKNLTKYRVNLLNTIDQHFIIVKQTNEVQKEKIKSDIRDLQAQAETNFSMQLESARGMTNSDDLTMRKIEQDCYKEIINEFKGATQRYDASFVEPYFTRLARALDTIQRRHEELLVYIKINEQRKISDLLLEAKDSYQSKMNKKCKGKCVEDETLEQTHIEAEKKAVDFFDSADIQREIDYKLQKRSELIRDTADLKEKYKIENFQNKKLENFEILKILNHLKDNFKKTMNESCKDGYLNDNAIEEANKQAKLNVESMLEKVEKERGNVFADKCRIDLDSLLNELFQQFQRQNKSEEMIVRNRLEDRLRCILESHELALEEARQQYFLDDNAMHGQKEASREAALNEFESATSDCDPAFIQPYRIRLNKAVTVMSERNNEFVKQKKDEVERKLMTILVESKEIYCNLIDKKCDGKYLESTIFEKAHDQAKQHALDNFMKIDIAEANALKETFKTKLLKDIDGLKQQYEQSNKQNKELLESNLFETVNRAIEHYQSSMEKVRLHGYVSDEDIRRAHTDSKQKAENIIQSFQKDKGTTYINNCRLQLQELLAEAYQKIQNENERKKIKECNNFENKLQEALQVYTKKLEKFRNSPTFEIKALDEIEETSRNAALNEFRKSTKRYSLCLVEEYQNNLKHEMTKAEEIHSEKIQELKNQMIRNLSQFCAQSEAKYREIMDKKCENIALDEHMFETFHDRALKRVIREFDSKEFPGGETIKTGKRTNLIALLEEVKEEYEEDNKQNLKQEKGLALKIVTDAKNCYQRVMDEACNDGYTPEADVHKASIRAKRQADAVVEDSTKDKTEEFRNNCRSQLNKATQEILNETNSINEMNKTKVVNMLQNKRFNCWESYKTKISRNEGKFIHESELQSNHLKFKQNSLSEYGNSSIEPETIWREEKTKLEASIDAAYELACRANAQNKIIMQEKAKKEVETSKKSYFTEMKSYCGEKYVEPATLETKHKNVKNSKETNFKSSFPHCFDEIKTLSKEIDYQYPTIKSINYDNKGCIIQ